MPPSIRRPSVKSAGVIVRRKSRLPLIDAPRQSERTKLLRATIIAAIITSPRHRLAILIVARFPSRLSRYSQAERDVTRPSRALPRAQALKTPAFGNLQFYREPTRIEPQHRPIAHPFSAVRCHQ